MAHVALSLLLPKEILSDSLGTEEESQPPAFWLAFTLTVNVLGNLSKTGVYSGKTELGRQGRALPCSDSNGYPRRVVKPHPYT